MEKHSRDAVDSSGASLATPVTASPAPACAKAAHNAFFVPLPTHSLKFTLSGPPRQLKRPLAVILPGVTCSITQWSAVRRLLEPEFPLLTYERAGYGESEESPNQPTAENIVLELYTALEVAGIRGPFVLVGHSFGGVLVREFVDLLMGKGKGMEVVGVVLVEANQEGSWVLWPDKSWAWVGDLALGEFWDVSGIYTEKKLVDQEWHEMIELMRDEKYSRTAGREMEFYEGSLKALGEKRHFEISKRNGPLWGDIPVSVIKGRTVRDHERVYEEAVRRGLGTEEERVEMKKKLGWYDEVDGRLQRELLGLSGRSKWVELERCGHWVHLTEPEGIVEEVRWVFNELAEK